MPINPSTAPFSFTPKATFLSDERNREAHNNYAGSYTAQTALTAAMAEMVNRQTAADPIMRAHAASKLEGAREFVAIWLNIGRPIHLPHEREIQSLKPV